MKREIVWRDLGDEIEHELLILTDVRYDDSDAIVLGLEAPGPPAERIEQRIDRPQRVLVATVEPPSFELVYDVEDGEQHQWLITLERLRPLPSEYPSPLA